MIWGESMNPTELLRELVSIPSVFPNENEISGYLVKMLTDLGFSIKTVDVRGRNNIIATYGKSKKYLCLYGHMDTVPPNAGMEEPYKLKEKGGIGRGLGAADMKGAIAAIMVAAGRAVKKGLPLKVAFGVDEENISEGAYAMMDSGALDDVDFLIGGESGNRDTAKEPFSVCYGGKGRIVFDATVHGVRSHAANKNDGINAIVKAGEFVCAADKMEFERHKYLGSTDIVIQSISGNADSFSLPDTCRVEFSVITTPNIKSAYVIDQLYSICKEKDIKADISLHKRPTPYGESYEVDRQNKFVQKLEGQLFRTNGITPMYAASVADENHFANRLGIPVMCIGPVSGGFHSVNEWIRMDSLDALVKAYEKAIELHSEYLNRN
jgi:acetylornithine deacetylase/succinyl-diaminopimelate desuccinylase-like protein